MSCTPIRPCGATETALGLVHPPPGQRPLRRRVGEFHALVADLVRRVEQEEAADGPLGARWDLEGDPRGALLAELWAYVAEGVAAYAELTAAEAYLATASDWTDLRRLAALVGYRPRPRVAAQGWVRVEVERDADPLVPAGTRMQAPGTPERAAQTFEVVADTPLRAEWEGLTATWVPTPAVPEGREMRFLGSPGFRAGDRVLFVLEEQPEAPSTSWFDWWDWLFGLDFGDRGAGATATPLAIASVVESRAELGTTVVLFDRDLDGVLSSVTAPYTAYRILATAGVARRLEVVLRVPATGTVLDELPVSPISPIGADLRSVVLDAPLEDLSAGRLVAVVDWQAGPLQAKRCDVVEVAEHVPVRWDPAPGTPTRVSRLDFAAAVPTLGGGGTWTVYVLDRRILARHYTFPATGAGPLRLYPRPEVAPARIAVGPSDGDVAAWEVFACAEAAVQEQAAEGDAPAGLIVNLIDGSPSGLVRQAPASGNLALVHHGAAASAVLGSGDAARAGQRFATPDAPIAHDLDVAGTPASSLELRVDGLEWAQRPSLYEAGREEVYVARLAEDGGQTLEFGDGQRGARLPTGRNNVTVAYRVGGGTAGEVAPGAIDTLLGSIRGVKRVSGAGPTTGGADQDDPLDLRRLAPTRARAFDRAVSIEDLVDLSLGFPGVSHAAAWNGQGPAGCACGASGLHAAFLRTAAEGPRAPAGAEIDQLAAFLDARRDTAVPLCVCGGVVTSVAVAAALAVDPRREAAVVAAAALAALLDPEGALAPRDRPLGGAVNRSDLYAVLQGVDGVVGVSSLDLPGAGELGRRAAALYELIVLDGGSAVSGAAA